MNDGLLFAVMSVAVGLVLLSSVITYRIVVDGIAEDCNKIEYTVIRSKAYECRRIEE